MVHNRQKIALGTAQFGLSYGVANQSGNKIPKSVVSQLLKKAREVGISTLDTAVAYGDSEEVLGSQNLNGFSIVSKIPQVPSGLGNIADWLNSQLMGSLSRLKVDKLDTLLLHRPEQLLELGGEELYQEIIKLKKQGLVDKIGVSVYGPKELSELIKSFDFDVIQAPMNIFDQRMETTGLLAKLKSRGVEVHIRSAFLQGLLLMPKEQIPIYFKSWRGLLNDYHNWIHEHNLTPLQACLGYLNQQQYIDQIIVGVDNLEQLEKIAIAIDKPIPEIPDFLQSTDENLINPSRWQL